MSLFLWCVVSICSLNLTAYNHFYYFFFFHFNSLKKIWAMSLKVTDIINATVFLYSSTMTFIIPITFEESGQLSWYPIKIQNKRTVITWVLTMRNEPIIIFFLWVRSVLSRFTSDFLYYGYSRCQHGIPQKYPNQEK